MSARLALTALICLSACTSERGGPAFAGHAAFAGLQDHSGITVALPELGLFAETDRFGYFAFGAVPRGTYDVTASSDGSRERQVAKRVTHGDGVTTVSLVLTPIGRLTGRVVNAEGQPVIGASIEVLGTDEESASIEGGVFVLDPVRAGPATVMATMRTFEPGLGDVSIPVGGEADVTLTIEPSDDRDPYAGNEAPVLGPIVVTPEIDSGFPRPIPLVDTSSGRVRRRGLYRLSVEVEDPDGDPVRLFWSADRGTIGDADETSVQWRAGPSVSTLVVTAVDAFGATATARKVVESTGDNLRGAGRYGDTFYYSERRSGTFDVYSYDLITGVETVVADGEMQQHAVTVVGDWLVYGDSEFVFIGDLAYRISTQNLITGTERTFGQDFGHDDVFVSRFDAYTPNPNLFVPYSSTDGTIAPTGDGFYDVVLGRPAHDPAPFSAISPGPINLRSFAYDGDAMVWFATGGEIWRRVGNASPVRLGVITTETTWPADVQMHGDYAVAHGRIDEPLWVFDLRSNQPARAIGESVSSFALRDGRVAYVEQGPTSASVELVELATDQRRTLSQEPHFARRIWYLDDEYVIWGDQGAEGQSFVRLNTELLWIDRL